ncbi:hypothetical protein POTOM_007049 [Populus tomentosa]|uniref:Uncharacterized protein n=1 Tax=Populus tomentosa TaxID=118781 RepID=A0A8X8DG38_POPTO|nr:hypothetical protein POTOM_007049 [Populus tomentosa]
MAEMKDAHIVEIPVDEEHQQKLICAMNTITAIQNHPLAEISNSPGHLLLLKLWQREEDLFGRRIALKESRMDSIKREIFQLCCFFLVFHGFFLTIVFTSSVDSKEHSCKNWWIPSLVSVCTSLVFVFLVQVKVCRYWKVWRQLQREKNDNRALTRCIQELRMKGASFDLSKEPLSGKKMKSSSVEIKWKPLTWEGFSRVGAQTEGLFCTIHPRVCGAGFRERHPLSAMLTLSKQKTFYGTFDEAVGTLLATANPCYK